MTSVQCHFESASYSTEMAMSEEFRRRLACLEKQMRDPNSAVHLDGLLVKINTVNSYVYYQWHIRNKCGQLVRAIPLKKEGGETIP